MSPFLELEAFLSLKRVFVSLQLELLTVAFEAELLFSIG